MVLVIYSTIVLTFLMLLIVWRLFVLHRRLQGYQDKFLKMTTEHAKELVVMEIETQERLLKYFSQEIHDNIGQKLSLARMQIGVLIKNESEIDDALIRVNGLLVDAIGDLRSMSKQMGSYPLDGKFSDTVKFEIDRIRSSKILDITMNLSGEECDISPENQLILIRVIQELFQNVIKHAHAKTAILFVTYTADKLTIVIKDDGQGFDPKAAKGINTGIGLSSVASRVHFLKGEFKIESRPNIGTTVSIELPLKEII